MIYHPTSLIISNKFDFSTDLIAYKLKNSGIEYLRLNRDQLEDYEIDFDPITPSIVIRSEEIEYHITVDTLKSVYYRAPTFLRDIVQENLTEEEQLYRTQWAAFVRSLSVFESVKWINNPIDTYKAEIKPYQLYLANKVGFKVPETSVTNTTKTRTGEKIAIKSIDTAIISTKDSEAFVYTTILDGGELQNYRYTSPFFVQKALTPKIDVRVTIIEDNVIAVKIKGEEGIEADWRKHKGSITYELFSLPDEIRLKCLIYTKQLNLIFSAIDLIIFNNEFYFIEINPTGEWAWLQTNTGFPFDSLIAKSLQNEPLDK